MRVALFAAVVLACTAAIVLVLRAHSAQNVPSARAEPRSKTSDAQRGASALEEPASRASPRRTHARSFAERAQRAPDPGATAKLTVLVVDADTHAPLIGVQAAVADAANAPDDLIGGGDGPAARTATDGRVELHCIAGVALVLELVPTDAGHASARIEIEPISAGETHEHTVGLGSLDAVELRALVVASDGGAPIAGARVFVNSTRHLRPAPIVSDAEGRFSLHVPALRSTDLEIEADGFSRKLVRVRWRGESTPIELRIALERSATLVVHVLDAHGAPIPDVDVELTANVAHIHAPDRELLARRGFLDDIGAKTATDARGVARFEELPAPVPYRVRVEQNLEDVLHLDAPLCLAPGEMRDVAWRIGCGCTITGTVLDPDGEPAENEEVWMIAGTARAVRLFDSVSEDDVRRAKSDKHGRFEIDDVPAGRWWIGTAPVRVVGKLHGAPLAHALTIASGERAVDVIVRALRDIGIDGVVLTPDGKPAASVQVAAHSNEGFEISGETRADGRFTLSELPPGEWKIQAWSCAGFAPSEIATAVAGGASVTLRLQAGAVIHGRIISASGSIDDAGSIVATPHVAELAPYYDGDWSKGDFRVRGLLPGEYDVTAKGAWGGGVGVVRGVCVEAEKDVALDVTLTPPAHVRASTSGRDSDAILVVLSGKSVIEMDEFENDLPVTTDVPPGAVTLRIWLTESGTTFDKTVTLAAGQTIDAVFDGAWK